MKRKWTFLLGLALLGIFAFSYQNATIIYAKKGSMADQKAVQEAIEDYVFGLYKADTTRIMRSVHPELRKRGFWYNKEKAAYTPYREMSYRELVDLSARWNVKGDRVNENTPRDIEIYEVQDKTAVAKLTAMWGTDYFHLGKIDGKWMIMNVIWQSPTPGTEDTSKSR